MDPKNLKVCVQHPFRCGVLLDDASHRRPGPIGCLRSEKFGLLKSLCSTQLGSSSHMPSGTCRSGESSSPTASRTSSQDIAPPCDPWKCLEGGNGDGVAPTTPVRSHLGLLAKDLDLVSTTPEDFSTPEHPLDLRSVSAMNFVEGQQILVHNLDTSDVRPFNSCLTPDGTGLGEDFVRARHWTLSKQKPGQKKPWGAWWHAKRRRDEQLWSGAESGDVEAIRLALSARLQGPLLGTQINARSLFGRTALHMAVPTGKLACVRHLLENGADIDARSDAGLSALHIACQRGLVQIAEALLDASAQVCAESNDGNLPIHLAASNGHVAIIDLLLDRGGGRQLLHRNSLGQRPTEASINISTTMLFRKRQMESSLDMAEFEHTPDQYAGRTPFHSGKVLLHNARADVVRRLLQRTQCMSSCTLHTSDKTPPSVFKSRVAVRKPFVTLRHDSPAVREAGPHSFALVNMLGKGAFGEVYEVKDKKTGQTFAMKVLNKDKIFKGNAVRYVLTERNVMSYIRHPYIVSLHHAFQTSNHLVLALQYCSGGNLQALLTREGRLSESTLARLYAAEVLLALIHLHERETIYRDLKPDNVVLDEYGHALLTDFGLSKAGVDGPRSARSFCGSMPFMAPEVLRQRGHGHAVDIYGLGVLLFNMLTGAPPFFHRHHDTIMINILHATLQVPAHVSDKAASLIRSTMDRDPLKRLGIANTADIQRHAFFAAVDWPALMRREVAVPSDTQPVAKDEQLQILDSPERKKPCIAPGSPFGEPTSVKPGPFTGKIVAGWEFATPQSPQLLFAEAAESEHSAASAVGDGLPPLPTFSIYR